MRALWIATLSILASCGDDGGGPTDAPSGGAKWQLLAENRASSLLAVWASGLDNIWVVGGRTAVGAGPVVWHYDGTAWTKLDTGETNVDLWQVFGFGKDVVFLAGSNGTILRYREGAFEKLPTPTTDIIFGLWGSSPDDVWAVGGQTTSRAFVWRYQGTQFEPVPGVPAELEMMGTVWKATGRAADDVWFSAARGTVLHWDGAQLSSERIGMTGESLFSMGCAASRCVTAGTNLANGVLYQHDGAGWTSRVPAPDGPVWRGVTPVGEHTYVVGMIGSVLRLSGAEWVSDPHGLTTKPLHAAWSDADGNLFAVGGDFDRAPVTLNGVMLYKGVTELPPLPAD